MSMSKLKDVGIQKYMHLTPKPTVERHLFSNHFDTRHWYLWEPRNNDIIIATPPKAGTTWTQRIVSQLIFNGQFPTKYGSVDEISPWVAMKAAPIKDQIKALHDTNYYPHQRFVKSHEPIGSVPFWDNVKYIFVGRCYKDVVWSMYNHYKKGNDFWYQVLNAPLDGNVPFEPLPRFNNNYTEHDLWKELLYTGDFAGNPDGGHWWSPLWVAGSWLKLRNNIKYNNILFIHYNNLKNDLSGEIKNIAEFLEIEYDKHMFDTIVNNCTFETMKNDPTSAPLGGAIFDGGSQSFINQGKTGRWKDTLTDQCIDDYKIMASRYMDDNQIKWMETGSD